jgi:hypothetical protein
MNLLSAVLITSTLLSASPPYPLDETSREVPTKGKLRCDRDALVTYAGDALRYHKKVTVHPAFRARLTRFEAVAKEVALEIYGRAPKAIRHMGTYNCRRIRSMPHLMSEHALGNAIDVAGFDFGPLPEGVDPPDGLSKRHRRGFKVRMKAHWDATGKDARHSRFLHTLAKRLTKADIFRVLLGPAWPGHDDHFHFDMAPYDLVKIFKD